MAWQGKSAADKRHHERVAQMPCLVCGAWPVDVHHVVGWADRMGRAPIAMIVLRHCAGIVI